MKYWFDTEFIEDGKTIDLLSIGVVAQDGREYYAVVNDSSLHFRGWCHPWLSKNVMPHLPHTKEMTAFQLKGGRRVHVPWLDESDPSVKSRVQIAAELVEFTDDGMSVDGAEPEFWAYFADYDWVVLCQLYGTMMELPRSWPMFCMDLKQLMVMNRVHKIPDEMKAKAEHHALEDARWNRAAHRWILQR